MKNKRNTFKYWKSFSLFTKKILLIPLYLQDLIFMHLLLQAAYTGVEITFFPSQMQFLCEHVKHFDAFWPQNILL